MFNEIEIEPKKVSIFVHEDQTEYSSEYLICLDELEISITKKDFEALRIKYSGEEMTWWCSEYYEPREVCQAYITDSCGEFFDNREDAWKRYYELRKEHLKHALKDIDGSKKYIENQLRELNETLINLGE